MIIFEVGGIAGLVTDSVTKIRMQSLKRQSQCRTSFNCDYRIFTGEGVLRFWTGTTPRLVRLVVSGFGGIPSRLAEITRSSQVVLSSPCMKR